MHDQISQEPASHPGCCQSRRPAQRRIGVAPQQQRGRPHQQRREHPQRQRNTVARVAAVANRQTRQHHRRRQRQERVCQCAKLGRFHVLYHSFHLRQQRIPLHTAPGIAGVSPACVTPAAPAAHPSTSQGSTRNNPRTTDFARYIIHRKTFHLQPATFTPERNCSPLAARLLPRTPPSTHNLHA